MIMPTVPAGLRSKFMMRATRMIPITHLLTVDMGCLSSLALSDVPDDTDNDGGNNDPLNHFFFPKKI
jgi:hypothetical protein